MKSFKFAALATIAALSLASPIFAADAPESGQGQTLVTVMPRNGGEALPNIQTQDLSLKIAGKLSSVTSWAPAKGENSPLELVLLIDSSARSSLGTQISEIQDFVKEMPSHSKMAIAYMENGRAALAGPLSSDSEAVLKGLHLPGGGSGQSASAYFCLSDLAQHWPSTDRSARREVVMITDGIDFYNLRYDPEDPYVQAAITDAARAGLVVYSIYWRSRGYADNSAADIGGGQNLLLEVTQATGGNSYWQGDGNPVSFDPYFKDLRIRFENQYRLGFASGLKNKAEIETLSLKVAGSAGKVTAPQKVWVSPAIQVRGE